MEPPGSSLPPGISPQTFLFSQVSLFAMGKGILLKNIPFPSLLFNCQDKWYLSVLLLFSVLVQEIELELIFLFLHEIPGLPPTVLLSRSGTLWTCRPHSLGTGPLGRPGRPPLAASLGAGPLGCPCRSHSLAASLRTGSLGCPGRPPLAASLGASPLGCPGRSHSLTASLRALCSLRCPGGPSLTISLGTGPLGCPCRPGTLGRPCRFRPSGGSCCSPSCIALGGPLCSPAAIRSVCAHGLHDSPGTLAACCRTASVHGFIFHLIEISRICHILDLEYQECDDTASCHQEDHQQDNDHLLGVTSCSTCLICFYELKNIVYGPSHRLRVGKGRWVHQPPLFSY